jgi:hypothetical protein
VPISELVFGTLTQNRSSLEPSLGFAAIAGTPHIENGGPFALVFAGGGRDGMTLSSGMRPKIFGVQFAAGGGTVVQPGAAQPFRVPLWQSRQIQEKAQDYSGFGLKPQTPTPKSAQLASRARACGTRHRDLDLLEEDDARPSIFNAVVWQSMKIRPCPITVALN